MKVFKKGHTQITLYKKGVNEYTKTSYPVRYGQYAELQTDDFRYHFNLNGEIRFIQGKGTAWPNPVEWLKRTLGNDWVYYSSGGYAGIYECMGEYYLPCLSYQTSSLIDAKPLTHENVKSAIAKWPDVVLEAISGFNGNENGALERFFTNLRMNDTTMLNARTRQFYDIIGGQVSVLPPDARHVDYDVIPVIISDGCLYNCGFCRVKSGNRFSLRSTEAVTNQIRQMKAFLGDDIVNYNALFLGQHDALNAPQETIFFAAEKSYDMFNFQGSYMKGAYLFMFGSVRSFLAKDIAFFKALDEMPYKTFINIGMESGDPATLTFLKKPIKIKDIVDTFDRMMAINQMCRNLEITLNFVIGEMLPDTHMSSILSLVRDRLERRYPKGSVYISPLHDYKKKRHLRDMMHTLKTRCRLPIYYYLIQRL